MHEPTKELAALKYALTKETRLVLKTPSWMTKKSLSFAIQLHFFLISSQNGWPFWMTENHF